MHLVSFASGDVSSCGHVRRNKISYWFHDLCLPSSRLKASVHCLLRLVNSYLSVLLSLTALFFYIH